MSFRRALLLTFSCLFFFAVLGGCSRGEANRSERLALLPFENLTPDPQLDWMTHAVPGTLAVQLASAAGLTATAVGAPRDVQATRATRALFGYFTLTGTRLRVAAQLRDVTRQNTIRTIAVEGDLSAGILPLIDRIARELDANVEPAAHRNQTATRDYWLAVTNDDPAQRRELLRRALTADPAFAPAHFALVQSAVAAGDQQAASAALVEARRASPGFTAFERARLDLLDARARQDTGATLRALNALTRLTPANDDVWRSLGELEMSRRNFGPAAAALERSLASDPGNISALNSLVYTRTWMGDLDGARHALARYGESAPGDANVQDTHGDVHFYFGRFAEAEKYYLEAHRINPGLLAGGDLYRAALSARFAGDLRRADGHFANWLAFRKAGGDPLLAVREAVWEASTGRLNQARTRLRQFVRMPPSSVEVGAAAASQLALFDKAAGERALAPAAPVSASAAVASFLCQADAGAAEWAQRARALPAAVRDALLGYALLLNGHFGEAVPVWRSVYQATQPAAESDARVMFAWALSASGRRGEAAALLVRAPISGRAAEPGLTFLTWSKYAELARRQ
ncbi:MAG TPA: tetratricopeptide repeat protein [Bryobacteraceae bacterium]|nr:tetratricopeptide repeat protein [Bryobacteraceae bacterium]